MADICVRHNVLIVSDEITRSYLPGVAIIPCPPDPAYQEITLVCTAPSKSFNPAGLQPRHHANRLRKNSRRRQVLGLSKVNCIGMVACGTPTAGSGWTRPWPTSPTGTSSGYWRSTPQIKLTKSGALPAGWTPTVWAFPRVESSSPQS